MHLQSLLPRAFASELSSSLSQTSASSLSTHDLPVQPQPSLSTASQPSLVASRTQEGFASMAGGLPQVPYE